MKARHRPEEADAGDALNRRVDRRRCIDETDGDVVAIDVVSLDDTLSRRGDQVFRRLDRWVRQAWRKRGGVSA